MYTKSRAHRLRTFCTHTVSIYSPLLRLCVRADYERRVAFSVFYPPVTHTINLHKYRKEKLIVGIHQTC